MNTLTNTFQRYRTLVTHKIHTLPVVILMPHSACNCRCIMCDIWQDNKNLKQLTEEDVRTLVDSLLKYKTRVVVMSGGEALLNKNFFSLCGILKEHKLKVSLLSTGLSLSQHAENIIKFTDEVIVSLDGNEEIHDQIRRIPNAYQKLREGVKGLKKRQPGFRVTARTVIQAANFKAWPGIIDSAKEIGLDQISFLPADVSSTAFNREVAWDQERKGQVQPAEEELGLLKAVIEDLIGDYAHAFSSGFIAESPEKIKKIHQYYSALYGQSGFPFKKCNAPWVSAVIEADGTVRHCFFLEGAGNIRSNNLEEILNSAQAISFRKNLNTQTHPTCARCVCYLNLSPTTRL